MLCQTIKVGVECAFMSKKGCGYNGGSCHAIVEQCEGCNRIMELPAGKYCRMFPDPASKWTSGRCPMASHIKRELAETSQKINPLKASKRAAKH